jgi:hypothetical protein
VFTTSFGRGGVLGPFLAGLDKFFNVLTDWGVYLSPLAERYLASPSGILGLGDARRTA